MATAAINSYCEYTSRGVAQMVWTATGITGEGVAMNAPGLPDKTVHIVGPTGGTSTVIIEGTNDATPTGTWTTLTDPQGNAISKTSDAIESILENPKYIRPRFSVVTSGKTIVVTIVARGDR